MQIGGACAKPAARNSPGPPTDAPCDWCAEERKVAGLDSVKVLWYIGTIMSAATGETHVVERVQTGVRIEKRLLKVLKAFAEYRDMSLGDLLEGILLHAFDGKPPFSEESRRRIGELKKFYELDLDSSSSHKLVESVPAKPKSKRSAR